MSKNNAITEIKKNPTYHSEPSKCSNCRQDSQYYIMCHAHFYGVCNNIICNDCWYANSFNLGDKPELYAMKYGPTTNPDASTLVCRKECSDKILYSTSMEEVKAKLKPVTYGFYIIEQRYLYPPFLYEIANSKEVKTVTQVVTALSLEEATATISSKFYKHSEGRFGFYVGIVGEFKRWV